MLARQIMPANKPATVSIITPTYNHEAFIGRCIESVLAQSYPHWELIVIDDGSTDKTACIAESYRDERIRVLRQGNQGIGKLAETYNAALGTATGEVIAILEGDDYWPPHKLDLQVRDFDDPSVVLSWGRAIIVSESEEPVGLGPHLLPEWNARLNVPLGRAAYTMSLPEWQTYTFPVTVLMRTSALNAIGGFHQPEYCAYVDMPTFMLLALEGSWRFHPEVVGYWRLHLNSVTKNQYPRMINAAYRWSAEFLSKYGDRVPAGTKERSLADFHWNLLQKDRLLISGRVKASQREFADARRFFERALTFRIGKRTRAMVRFAILLTYLGMSPEVAFRLGRQRDFREQSQSTDRNYPTWTIDMRPEEYPRYELMQVSSAG